MPRQSILVEHFAVFPLRAIIFICFVLRLLESTAIHQALVLGVFFNPFILLLVYDIEL